MPKIQFKRGLEAKLPVLAEGEPAFTTDSEKLFVGSAAGNVEVARKVHVDEVQTDLQGQIDSHTDQISQTNARFDDLQKVDANAEVMAARGGEQTLGARLDKVSSSLADRTTKSVLEFLCDDGQFVKGDGIHDDTTGIQNAINSSRDIYFPDGNYKITNTIVVTGTTHELVNGTNRRYGGKNIRFSPKARIMVAANVNGIQVQGCGNTILNPVIDVSLVGSSFTKAALYLESLDTASNACTSNRIDGLKATQAEGVKNGAGISLKATGASYMYKNYFTNFEISEFYWGIKMDDTSINGINANQFQGVLWASTQAINAQGSGNSFTFTGQAAPADPANPDLACIYIKGNRNTFSGYIYDVGSPQVKNYYEFANGSTRNTIVSNAKQSQVLNPYNMKNHFLTEKEDEHQFVLPAIPGSSDFDDYTMASGHYIPSKTFNLISGLNNILGRAELISSVSAVKSNMSFIGINPDIQPDRIKRMFNHQKINRDYNTVMKFKAADSTQVATLDITINFAAEVNDMFMIDSVGLLLGMNSAASTGSDLIVTITATTSKGNTITFSKFGGDTVSPQINNALLFKAPKGTSYYQNAVTQLKIHLEIPPNKLTSYSTLSYIHANGIDEYGSGSSFPFIGGDTFSGDVGFTTDNTIVPGKTAALPTASSTQRGRILRIEGATGVSDGVYICAKLSDDTYVWKSIGHDANTTANRPTTNLYIGRRYFDTSLGKPIWLKQVSPAVWVDATGTTV